MKILLIGGTGILSKEIRDLALERNTEVYTLNRGKRKDFISDKTINIVADVINEDMFLLRKKICITRYDVVIDFISRDVNQLKKIISIVDNICDQFIFISSATCYAEQEKGHRYVENDPINNRKWNYCIKKAECEDYLKSNQFHFQYTIVRPYITYGETRIPFQVAPLKYYTIVQRMINNKPLLLVNKNAKCTLTNAKEFAIAVVGLMKNEKAYSEAFHVTSCCEYTWEQVVNIIAEAFERKVNIIEVPLKYIKSLNNVGVDLDELEGDKARDMIFDNSKIRGVVPEFKGVNSLEKSVEEIKKYYDLSSHQEIDYLWDGYIDRILFRYLKAYSNNLPEMSRCIKNTGVKFKEKIMYFIGRYELVYTFAKRLRR